MGWSAHQQTGLTYHQAALSDKGYTLVSPLGGDAAYLLDMDGRIVHRWHLPGWRIFTARLLPSGSLAVLCSDAGVPVPPQVPYDQPQPAFDLRVRQLGGHASHLRELDWDGRPVWEYQNAAMHHDFVRLGNGNTLVAEWVELPPELDRRVRGAARRPSEKFPPLISDDILEIDPAGKELRRFHLWQLLDPVRDPICPLEPRREWTHLNSLDALPDGGIVFSCRSNSRVGIIEPSGDRLRWKFGAPEVVHQHHASTLANGNIQIFDNGMHRIGMSYSRVVEVNPADSSVVWTYTGEPQEQFFSGHISGAERRPNGNVLVCEGTSGRVFEVTQRGETVWEWLSPFTVTVQGNRRAWIFRAHRYGPDFPGLAGRALDPAACAALNRLYGL